MPKADAGSSPAGSNKWRWRCVHELEGMLRVLRIVPAFGGMLGSLALVTHAHWTLTGAIYVLTAIGMGLAIALDRKLERVSKADLAQAKTEMEAAQAMYKQNIAIAPVEVLEAMVATASLPAELRAELQVELVRRGKGVLN